MARLRAVVMIQPAGLGGSPADGHRCNATMNASWTASSAMSMSPKMRTRLAAARPDSSRKTRSTSAVLVTERSGLGLVLEGTDLDRASARPGGLGGPVEGRVEVGALDDPEATDVLFGLGEGAVGGQDLVVLHLDDGGGVGRMQAAAEHPDAFLLHRVVEGSGVGERLLHLFLVRVGVLALHHVH